MAAYGSYFKALRESKSLTLRAVEAKTGVSNAYLSQLESEKIKQPSPTTLFKLAELYGAPYERLMEKVGYPVPKAGSSTVGEADSSIINSKFGNISNEEEIELLQYLKFIRNKN